MLSDVAAMMVGAVTIIMTIAYGAHPDMIIIVPLNMLVADVVLPVTFGSEGGKLTLGLGMGPYGPRIGMILFRGTWAFAPSQPGRWMPTCVALPPATQH